MAAAARAPHSPELQSLGETQRCEEESVQAGKEPDGSSREQMGDGKQPTQPRELRPWSRGCMRGHPTASGATELPQGWRGTCPGLVRQQHPEWAPWVSCLLLQAPAAPPAPAAALLCCAHLPAAGCLWKVKCLATRICEELALSPKNLSHHLAELCSQDSEDGLEEYPVSWEWYQGMSPALYPSPGLQDGKLPLLVACADALALRQDVSNEEYSGKLAENPT